MLQGDINNLISIQRTEAVTSTLNAYEIKTQQLESVNTYWSRELAKTSIENLFFKYNNKIEAIIVNNDDLAIGAIEALQKYGYNKGNALKNIPVFGIDGTQEAINLIDEGIMTGTVIEDSKALAEGIYTIAMNLVNNLNPITNVNAKIINGEIALELIYKTYTGKTNNP